MLLLIKSSPPHFCKRNPQRRVLKHPSQAVGLLCPQDYLEGTFDANEIRVSARLRLIVGLFWQILTMLIHEMYV